MNKANLAMGGLSVPAIAGGTNYFTDGEVLSTLNTVKDWTAKTLKSGDTFMKDSVLPVIDNGVLTTLTSSIAGGVAGGLSAGLLTHNVLGQFDWMEEHKKIKYLLTTMASAGAFVGGSAIAPYLMAAGASYGIGSGIKKYGPKVLKSLSGMVINGIGCLPVALGRGGVNGLKEGPKWPVDNDNFKPVFGKPTSTNSGNTPAPAAA